MAATNHQQSPKLPFHGGGGVQGPKEVSGCGWVCERWSGVELLGADEGAGVVNPQNTLRVFGDSMILAVSAQQL